MSLPTLQGLPAEIRLQIYSFLFADTTASRKKFLKQYPVSRDYPTNISRTCKQLRDESVPAFYRNVKVCLEIGEKLPDYDLTHCFREIGADNARLLRRFEFRWWGYVDIGVCIARGSGRAAPQTRTSSVGRILRMMEIPNVEAMTGIIEEPASGTRAGRTHLLTVSGIRRDLCEQRRLEIAVFCGHASTALSRLLDGILDGGMQLSTHDIDRFCREAQEVCSDLYLDHTFGG
ncbi:Hypothetical predicted protein [Lecanosticta acicola]|uniref:Uncharacterized protein n=1 Tax=Lecanosticta acicola TaxID=111012 RepID=A0AAI8YZ54_9PEZI|nr:Hypothetical predicted protein [Lecanosticta acicola]